MTSPKKHHYVPVSYLNRFAAPDGYLAVYDAKRSEFRRQRAASVLHINRYYRQEWAPPGTDPDIMEKALGRTLEKEAKLAIDNLIMNPRAIDEDQAASLVTYLEFQRIRVPRQAEMGVEAMRQLMLKMIKGEVKAELESGRYKLVMKNSARFDYIRYSVGTHVPWFREMDWEVVEAESGSGFITTDSPVSFYNPRAVPPEEAGLGFAGTVVFFPLSSRFCLLMRHPMMREVPDCTELTLVPKPTLRDRRVPVDHGTVWARKTVKNFNLKMAKLASRFLVASEKGLLEEILDDEA